MKKNIVLMTCLLLTGSLLAQNTGIGTNTPYSRLHLNGTAWFQGDNTPLSASAGSGIAIGLSAGATGGYIFAFNYSTFTPRNIWLQSPGGSVLIGSTTAFPGGKLDVNGTGSRAIYASTTSGEAFYGSTSGGNGIVGISASALGMYAVSNASNNGGLLAEGGFIGIQGTNKGSDVNRQAVRGENSGAAGGYAGLFNGGSTWVAGTLFKNAGAFLIDHPVDPESKFLIHSFVESPDMKNIYDGIATTNASGLAVVTLPDWFEALNMDYRYQLTCIGEFAEAIVQNEISGNIFTIKTNKPNVKVSWQVTGIRNDPYARENRLSIEKPKLPDEVGKYIFPQGYGKSDAFLLDILKPTNLAGKAAPSPKIQ